MATRVNIANMGVAAAGSKGRLLRLLDGFTDRNASDSPDIVRAGDFCIDVAARSAKVRGQELRLSGTEFDVLVYLASHRKRVVTAHTRLATKPEECGVRQAQFLPALLSLRKKLEEAVPEVRYIQTEAWLLYDFHPAV